MIKKVQLIKFKKFGSSIIELNPNEITIVVGGNNSGKSSLLQALAIWNYAKSVIIFYKKRVALNKASRKDGVGIGFDDFTPLNIPSFDYLWTNLKSGGGYTLKVKVYWDDNSNDEKFLEIGFALTQDRLFVKKTDSNIEEIDFIPEIAYLPPFAGISEKEPWLSVTDRRKQIGRGLSGSVLRNLIYDFYNEYLKELDEIKGLKGKKRKEREVKLSTCNFININKILSEVFSLNLYPDRFSLEFHNYLKVPLKKGSFEDSNFVPYSNFSARDIMAEGRGFLQWLSTLCLLFDNKINILLLDEPDAHLHAILQVELLRRLQEFVSKNNKQVLVATHSAEVIKSLSPTLILQIEGGSARYCKTESQIKSLLLGLGVEHFPLLHKIQTLKKVVFIEADFDRNILNEFANKLSLDISDKVVFWPMANNHKDRKQVFLHLKDEISNLKIISVEDKDNSEYNNTNRDLSISNINQLEEGNCKFYPRRWRRWELENYLINPRAIGKTCLICETEVETELRDTFGIHWPIDFKSSDRTNSNGSLFDREGKLIIEHFENKYGISKYDICKNFDTEDIPEDIIELIVQICEL